MSLVECKVNSHTCIGVKFVMRCPVLSEVPYEECPSFWQNVNRTSTRDRRAGEVIG